MADTGDEASGRWNQLPGSEAVPEYVCERVNGRASESIVIPSLYNSTRNSAPLLFLMIGVTPLPLTAGWQIWATTALGAHPTTVRVNPPHP